MWFSTRKFGDPGWGEIHLGAKSPLAEHEANAAVTAAGLFPPLLWIRLCMKKATNAVVVLDALQRRKPCSFKGIFR